MDPSPEQKPRRRRRWPFYALAIFAVLLAVGIATHQWLLREWSEVYRKTPVPPWFDTGAIGNCEIPSNLYRDTGKAVLRANTSLGELTPEQIVFQKTEAIWAGSTFPLGQAELEQVTAADTMASQVLRTLDQTLDAAYRKDLNFRIITANRESSQNQPRWESTHAMLGGINRFAAAEAWRHAAAGDRDTAWAWVEHAFAIAHLMENETGLLSNTLRLAMGQGAALTAVKAMLQYGPLTPEQEARLTYHTERLAQRRQIVLALIYEINHMTDLFDTSIEKPNLTTYIMLPKLYQGMVQNIESMKTLAQAVMLEDWRERADAYTAWEQSPETRACSVKDTLGHAAKTFEDGIARGDMLRLTAAIRRYHAEKGTFPEQLENLVPDYVVKLPRDVYNGEVYAYRPEVTGCTLSSVGVLLVGGVEAAPEDLAVVCRLELAE